VKPSPISNMASSVRQRLLNKARAEQRPFNELLQYYAMERFLYRLCCSPHVHSFILKGAMMLRVWHTPFARPTMDIDLLGRTSNDDANIETVLRDIMLTEVPSDGLHFDAASIAIEAIAADAEYHGVRVYFPAHFGTARISMRVDIGFSDRVYPGPEAIISPRCRTFRLRSYKATVVRA
jgi:hypothetical protein